VEFDHPKMDDDSNGINLYKFVSALNENLKDDSVIVWDAGSCTYVLNQSLKLNGFGQRTVSSLNQGEMGAAIGMSIGACYAKGGGEVICVVGDGSFSSQLHELSVLDGLPIKIFVWNNGGYLSIRNSQKNFYQGRVFGADSSSGVWLPEIKMVALAYGISYERIDKVAELSKKIGIVMSSSWPTICEVMCDPNQLILPTSAPKKDAAGNKVQVGLDDMYPFIEKQNEKS